MLAFFLWILKPQQGIGEEKDTTLLLQVDLMRNNMTSQIIDLPSLKDLKEKKATMVKKASQNTTYIRKFKLVFRNSKHFKIFKKLQNETKEKLAALGKVL